MTNHHVLIPSSADVKMRQVSRRHSCDVNARMIDRDVIAEVGWNSRRVAI